MVVRNGGLKHSLGEMLITCLCKDMGLDLGLRMSFIQGDHMRLGLKHRLDRGLSVRLDWILSVGQRLRHCLGVN